MSGETETWRERAHRSVNGLSATQKIAAGCLTAVAVAAALWMTNATSVTKIGMEPVLDQAFPDAQTVQIAQRLSDKKVPHEVRDGKVYVPADRKLEVLSDLMYTDTLTASTESGFDELVKQSSIFDTPSKTDKMFNIARQRVLAGIIGGQPGVRKATVIIDPTNERHIGGESVTPVAMVDIQTRGKEANPRQLASAAVNTITGAVSAMARDRVKVNIDGASYNVGADNLGDDLMARRQQCEQAYVGKVRQLLGYIPDVLVSVSVDLNVQSLEEEKHLFDPENSVRLESRTETRVEHTAQSTESLNAVLANAVPLIADKPAEAVKPPFVKSENVKTDYTVFPSETVQKTKTPAGKETVLSASVVVPRGYFLGIYRRSNAKAAEVSDALLQPVIDTQLVKIRHLVRTSLGLKNDADVTVDVYEDGSSAAPAPAVVASVPREQAVVLPSVASLWNHRTQWGLAIFGAMTLLLVSTVLRRGSGAMAAPQPVETESGPLARVHPMRAAGHGRLNFDDEHDERGVDDHEADADLLRQVRELASARPQDAARVLREWIYQG